LFDRFPDPLLLLDEGGCVLEANRAACELTGLSIEDLLGRSIGGVIEISGDFQAFWNRFRQMDNYRAQAWMLRGDGTRRLVEITGSPNVVPQQHLVAARDVTNHHFLDDQLIQRERNEALAKLSGGIAHDMTNLFNVIGGYIELIVRQIAPGPELQLHIDRLLAAAQQGAALTSQLSALGHQQILSPAVLDLTLVVHSCSRALRSVVPGNVEIILPRAGDLAPVRVDRTQMAQVIFTLASTAGELLPHGGFLKIEVNRQSLERPLEWAGASIPPGEYVVLRFEAQPGKLEDSTQRSPSGSGPDQRKDTGSVFPPVVHALKQNDGHLWLERGAAGTVVYSVYFPSMAGQPIGVPEQAPAGDLGGNETILLVEDDPGLRETMCDYLKGLGYRILRAGNGEDALRKVQPGERLDLVITDLNLPRMGGEELARRIAALQPGVKILFVSGNMDPGILSRFSGAEIPIVLCKPFQLRGLASTLRNLLDHKAHRAKSAP
jgi:PAS domain S-box-containing protein